MGRSIEGSTNITIITNNNSSLADGSASSPSLSFEAEGDLGIYRKANNTMAFSTDSKDRLIVSDLTSEFTHQLKLPTIRITTGASNGAVLTSDVNGLASWFNPFNHTRRTTTGDITPTGGSIVSVDYNINKFNFGSGVIILSGWIEFNATVVRTGSLAFDFANFVSLSGFTPTVISGVVDGQRQSFLRDLSYNLTIESGGIPRITITNNQPTDPQTPGSTDWTGGKIGFNIILN
jgi:hypothetical protein